MLEKLKGWIAGDTQELKRIEKKADEVMALEEQTTKYTDEELQEAIATFKEQVADGTSLDDLLVDVYAVVREAAKRVLGLHPYKVQVMAGIVLHEGNLAEAKTGEGKTLMATMPIVLNALSGQGVHVVTVNDYLAERDGEDMGRLYEFLGFSVAVNSRALSQREKQAAYQSDILYSTNSELGFDYLRDNMVQSVNERVQRPLHYAVIDEADSVLIDEARTPLIISGRGDRSNALYRRLDLIAKGLKEHVDFEVDDTTRTVAMTQEGISKVEDLLRIDNLYDSSHQAMVNHLDLALRANYVYERDVDYMVVDGKVMLVDAFTGRVMEGRRMSEGLHQAYEAKENVDIEDEQMTLASITYQNFFRLYDKLAGMTGTAKTEAEEFREIYNMDVVEIPTNEPVIRLDQGDLLYVDLDAKLDAVINDVAERHEKGQPILIGTVSVEMSQYISRLLDNVKINHEVLNAKNHEREAEIIAQAGQLGAVTVATNMAGRGTDIKLGHGVRELGGLYVIGTERHESRRIDNQLRGRSGRQGDPGESRFYISLDDELMVRFGADQAKPMIEQMVARTGRDKPIESGMLTRQVEGAQERVEGNNYDMRKNVLEYDEVMRRQREVIYKDRDALVELTQEDLPVLIENTKAMMDQVVVDIYNQVLDGSEGSKERAKKQAILTPDEKEALVEKINLLILRSESDAEYAERVGITTASVNQGLTFIQDHLKTLMDLKLEGLSEHEQFVFLKVNYLNALDHHWMRHIDRMDHLRRTIGLRGYAQINPLNEYQREGRALYEVMLGLVRYDVVEAFFWNQAQQAEERMELNA